MAETLEAASGADHGSLPSTDARRRLAAILSADVVGYSRLMAEDEDATIRAVTARREQVELQVRQHGGRLNDFTGDNFLAEFGSAVQALECAVQIQRVVAALNAELPPERKMEFRVGLHLGEVRVQDERLFGTGVNVAARLEGLADPGGICISAVVHEQLGSQLDLVYEAIGKHSVKNIPKPVGVYRVRMAGSRSDARRRWGLAWARPRIVAASLAGLISLVAVALWLSWPVPPALVVDLAGRSGSPMNPPLPDEPSIVVLPFDNLSGDPEHEYFADGVTEDLTTDLARYPGIFVIARDSASTYKGRPIRVEDVGRELGVRYAVEGSLRKAGDQIRINAQLIDAASGLHVWAERYDHQLADIFALQDEIVTAILESVGAEIVVQEEERARSKPTADLNAYQAFMKGRSHIGVHTRRANAEARRWFTRAIELDPGYAEAHQWLGATYVLPYAMGWDLDPGLLDRADEQARRCLELGPSVPICHVGLAGVAALRGNAAGAIRHAERAIGLAPGHFAGHFYLGMGWLRAGQPLEAIPSLERAIRLNPHGDGIARWLAPAYVLVGREREALEIYERATAVNPEDVAGRIFLASYHEAAGDHAQARLLVEQIRAVKPDLTVPQIAGVVGIRALGEERLSAILENLRRAGLPDHVEAAP
jgi:adenylate cyclase